MPLSAADLTQITNLITSQLASARIKISELPAAGAVTREAVFPIVDSGSTQKLSLSQLLAQGVTSVPVGQDLRNMDVDTIADGDIFYTVGVGTPGDGGEGLWMYDANSVATDNIGTVIAPDSGVGRFIRQFTGPLNVRWFEATGDGTTNDTAAIQATVTAAAAALTTLGGAVYIPTGDYYVTDNILITSDRTHIFGDGIYATRIIFNPAAGRSCFKFANGASMLTQGSIRGMAFAGQGAQAKVAVEVVDTTEVSIIDIAVQAWTGATSIGIKLKGRELTRIDRVSIAADRPISIEENPNSGIDCDHCHMSNMYLLPQVATEACITIAASLAVTNLVIDGYNAFVGGKYAILSSGGTSCFYWNIQNVRYEQAATATDFAFNITGVNELKLTNCQAGTVTGGYKFRTCSHITLDNCTYEGTGVSLDVNGTCDQLHLDNVLMKVGSTESTTGMTEVMAIGNDPSNIAGTSSHRFFELTQAAKWVKIYGVRIWQQQLDVPSGAGARVNLGAFTGAQKAAIVEVSAYDASVPRNIAGIVSVVADSASLIATNDATYFGVGNVANKLTVFFEAASVVSLFNQLASGATVRVMVSVREATA